MALYMDATSLHLSKPFCSLALTDAGGPHHCCAASGAGLPAGLPAAAVLCLTASRLSPGAIQEWSRHRLIKFCPLSRLIPLDLTQAARIIAARPPELGDLPDHLLERILSGALAPLRAARGAPGADAAVREWTAYARVCRK